MRGLTWAAVGMVVLATSATTAETVRSWSIERDSSGRPIRRGDPAGRTARYGYDSAGRLGQVRYSDGTTVGFTYLADGRRATMTDPRGATRYEYDPLRRPSAVVTPRGPRVGYEYDLEGRLRRLSVGDGWTTTYAYDLMGRLVRVEGPVGTVRYVHQPGLKINGRPSPRVVRTLPNGVATTWTYDADGQLVRLRHERGSMTLADWSYQRDDRGRVASITEETSGRVDFEYDARGRLGQVRADAKLAERYEYDRGNNLTRAERRGATHRFGLDGFGQLATIDSERQESNAAGEPTRRTLGGRTDRLDYDADGRLVTVATGAGAILYVYDGDGNLVERRQGDRVERFVLDVSGGPPRVLAVLDGDDQPRARFLMAPQRLAVRDGAGKVHWLLEDHRNSVALVVDASGQPEASASYSAFGVPTDALAPASGFGFAGEWRDPATGLVFLRARWYDPETGRFLTPDPYWGRLDQPASLNRFSYARNDPVNLVDPTGYDPRGIDEQQRALQELQRLLEMTRAFPGASRVADRARQPDFIAISGSLPMSEFGVPGAQAVLTEVIDRNQHRETLVSAAVGLGKGAIVPEVRAGAYYILGPTPTSAQIHEFGLGAGLDLQLGRYDFLLSNGRLAVGAMTNRELLLTGSYTVSPNDLSADLGALLAKLDLGRQPPSSSARYATAYAATVAEALAANPFKYPTREATETKLADLRERLAHAGPLDGQKVYTDWALGASYSSIEQVEAEKNGAVLGLLGSSTGGGGTPRVGGIFLKTVAEVLGTMGSVEGARYDAESGRVVLLGGSVTTKTGRVRPDDLAVALRAVAEGRWPGFSIDPNPADPHGPVMLCRYLGPTERTAAGLTMFRADRLLKDIGRGEDETGNPLRPNVKGFADQFELGFALKQSGNETWNRFWIVPRKIEWQASPDGKTLWCRQAAMGVKTEVMRLENGKLVSQPKGTADPAATRYADFFSAHYDDFAREYPAFEEVRQLAQIIGLVAWLKEQLPPDEFDGLVASVSPAEVATPVTTPATTVKRTRTTPTTGGVATRESRIYGGVDLTTQPPSRVPEDAGLATIGPAIERALPPSATPRAADVPADGRTIRAVALPVGGSSTAGGLTLHVADMIAPLPDGSMLTLARHYHSTVTAPGEFGRGWRVLVPEIRRRGTGATETVVVTDAWGRFEQVAQAPSFRAIKLGTEASVLTEADGSTWQFGPTRQLVHRKRQDVDWDYAYDDHGRLSRIAVTQGGKTLAALDFEYDERGLVRTVRDQSGREVRYEYDADQRLVAVRSGSRTLAYAYDAGHHLTSLTDGDRSARCEYTPEGFLVRTIDERGRETRFERLAGPDGGTRVRTRRPGSDESAITIDARGRTVRAEQGGVGLTRQSAGATRELAVSGKPVLSATTRRDQHEVVVDLPGDRRATYHLNADGSPNLLDLTSHVDGGTAQVLFDPTGQPTWMSDPTGGEYTVKHAADSTRIVAPVGTAVLQSDGRTAKLELPSGRTFEWSTAANRKVAKMSVVSPSGTRDDWEQTDEQTWQHARDGKSVGRVRSDDQGRTLEVADADGPLVQARHDGGETVATVPDGRRIVVKRDDAGRIVEQSETAINSEKPIVVEVELNALPSAK